MTTLRVPRRVHEVSLEPGPAAPNEASSAEPSWLKDHRDAPAYVLLGEPGSGKTTAFEMEADADPERSVPVSARDFTELDLESHPEWRGKTLFIDGLDEMRTASGNWRRPLDSIRKRLERLGHPRFRLSCRTGEWLGEDDAAALRRLGAYHELVVLRLDPLDEDEVRKLLEDRVGPAGASELMGYAHEYGLYGVLQHPLSVELLLEAGMDTDPISGRRGLFESACKSMSRERNPAHRAAARGATRPSEGSLLHASGGLCALNLLTDSLGWAVDPVEATPGYPSIREIENADPGIAAEELGCALRTRLFAMTPTGCFQPIHRQIAEFLGGRFLGRLAEGRSVSPLRLRALMAGDDGAAAPSLRGLAAWIAVHSPAARPSLIRDDPVGVAIYGDPSEFSREDQRQLLRNLRVRAREIDIWHWPPSALPSLAAPGALPVVRDMISAPERDDATQSLASLALRALVHTEGSSIPRELQPPLLGVVRDSRWWPGTRAAAMKAWIGSSSADGRSIDEALKLLKEIEEDALDDPRGSLTGLLLGLLYPGHVTPEKLWDYARPVAPDPIGSGHLEFWPNELPRRSEEEGCLAEVLDSLCRWLDGRPHGIDDSCTRDGVAGILAHALEQHGDDIETERLYAWLAAVLPLMPSEGDLELSTLVGRHLGVDRPEVDIRPKVDAWLRDRPSTQKALMLEIVCRQDDDDIILGPADPLPPTGSLTLDDVLTDAPAADFAPWFLEQAVLLSESRPWLACHMLRRTGVGTADALTVDEVRSRVSGHPALEECLQSLFAPVPQPNRQHPLALERARKRKEWIDWVRRQAGALARGEGPPNLYHDVASAYLGVNRSVRGDTPGERVRSLFLGDDELSCVALDGLRRVPRRTDLPTLDELVRLDEDGRISYFILPLLAALEEEERIADEHRARPEGETLRRALGSLLLAKGRDIPDPVWYRRALQSNAEEVADAFVKVYGSRIRRSSGVDKHLHALTRAGSHAEVARLALPRLLMSFPAKATAEQVFHLDYLIPAALEHVDPDDLASIVHRKLATASLRIGHRIRWLATGMFLGDPLLGQQLDHFLSGGSDSRARELAAFLKARTVSKRVRSLPGRSLAMLVRRLGGYHSPVSGGVPGYMSFEVDESLQTDGLIRTALDALSYRHTPEATELLHALLDDEDLAAWREPIAEALDAQRVVRRDAEFVPPTIQDVLSVLNDGRPASAADLAALTVDRIRGIGAQMRDMDADEWRDFWNEGEWGKPRTPKIEPSCELALLRRLRRQMPEPVRVETEVRHAGGTRADLQVSFGDFAVPVETKLSSSRDLWTAAMAQLIPRYARDPRSDGYGIYVVFWHGPEYAKRPTPTGTPPRTPGELQDRLTQQLPSEAQPKVSVIVLNVSPP